MKIVNWFNDIPLASKISIIGLLALVSVAIPTYLFISTINEKIEVTELEVMGLEPSKNTLNVMKYIAKTRGLSVRLLNGEDQVSSQLMNAINKVNTSLSSLPNSINPSISSDVILQLINEIQGSFTSISNSVQNRNVTASEAFSQFNLINLKVQNLLREIVNRSKLSYNPKPESAYLISAELVEFPRMIERLGQVRGTASGIFANDNPTLQETVLVRHMMDETVDTANRYFNQINDAAQADNSLQDLKRSAQSNLDAISNLAVFLENSLQSLAKNKVSSQKVFSEFSLVIDNQYLSHQRNLEELHKLIFSQHDKMAQAETVALTIIFVLLATATLVSFYIVKSINEAVVGLGESAKRIAQGDFEQQFQLARKDELGALSQSLKNMSEQLGEAAVVADEAVRIKQALDCTTSNIMIADDKRIINYVNPAALELFREAEKDIQSALPNFDANKLVGSNFDIFHANPKHQREVIKELHQAHTAQIEVGKRHFNLVASPIVDGKGNRQGTVVEWVDRTFEVLAEQDLAMLIDAASQGDFSKRASISGKDGILKTLAEGLNQIFQQTEQGLSDVNTVLMALAKGDLSKSITNEYHGIFNELKDYCNNTTANLSEMIAEVRGAVDLINNASNEIAQGNADLSSRTEEQASSLEETASSMEELTSTVKLNSENANRANGLASEAANIAEDGGVLISQVVENMSSINDSARKISDIIGVIDGIAFQTNILALNAAVEAARAGEQGRGFAVVASEVRTLAQRSATAAKDIKALISDSVTRIEGGNELVNKSGDTMNEIVVSIQRVNDLMAEIAAASSEQSTGINEVGKAISQMDDVTQQNAALVEQAAASAESLRAQSIQLAGQVSKFKISEALMANLEETSNHVRSPLRPQRTASNNAQNSKKTNFPDPIEDDWESF